MRGEVISVTENKLLGAFLLINKGKCTIMVVGFEQKTLVRESY